MNEFQCKLMKNVDLESNWDYACFAWIVLMSYFPFHDLMNWMCLLYGGFKIKLSVSSSMRCYLLIVQVWPTVVLDDAPMW